MVETMDTEIGRLLSVVDCVNTHIIFIGDNGTPTQVLQPPFRAGRGKDTLYEGGIHVPLIISGPAVARPNRTNATLANAVDSFATILEMAGSSAAAAVPNNVVIDSKSLMSALQTTNTLSRFAYAEEFGTNVPVSAGVAPSRTIATSSSSSQMDSGLQLSFSLTSKSLLSTASPTCAEI